MKKSSKKPRPSLSLLARRAMVRLRLFFRRKPLHIPCAENSEKIARQSEQDSATPPGAEFSEVPTRMRRKQRPSHGKRGSFCRICGQCALLLLLCGSLFLTLILTVSTSMVHLTADRIVEAVHIADALSAAEETADYDCILVLGAGVRDDGTPSDMLYDRVMTACAVYGAAEEDIPLLMSGDHTGDYNEVSVMKSLAVSEGIPSEQIFLDHEGYSTYESLYRVKEMFGARRIVIVTQAYHLHRALYIARELGLEAIGVPADLRTYRGQAKYEVREMLARFKDLFTAARGEAVGDVDEAVDLKGNGDLTN